MSIFDGIARVTEGFWNALIPDEETARRIGERYLSMYSDYVDLTKRDLL